MDDRLRILGIHRAESSRLHIHAKKLTLSPEEIIRKVRGLPFVAHTGHVLALGIIVVVYRGCTVIQMEKALIDCLWEYRKRTS